VEAFLSKSSLSAAASFIKTFESWDGIREPANHSRIELMRNVTTRGGGLFLLLLQALLLTFRKFSGSLCRSSRFRLMLGVMRIGALVTIPARTMFKEE
jgi:predicted small integral membrane protein